MSTADDQDLSPSERYSSYRKQRQHPVVRDFAGLYDFPLDDFQRRGCEAIEEGRSVLVAAPTGSGKTIVGEFAVHLALETGRKAFFTTPIKALSNQKYADLVARYGPDKVGLLTGDNVVNGEAPIVVMTTEVLRNMLYAGSRTLLGLGFVVMDEVHYLADRARGAVWEEVIIHLPESVALVSLSATVSNAEEFGEWLETVRGDTTVIVEERRPVPLYQHVMVGKRLLDLFASSDVDAAAGFVKEGAPVNDELLKVARDDWASSRIKDRRTPRGRSKPGQRQVGNGRRVWIPSRVDVIDRLDREGLLPAIVFVFSRVGCDAAVTQCLNAGIRLTKPEERDEIFAFVEASCRHLPADDLQVLGYHDFLDGLTRGVAAHHAGMLPAFKQCVEELYVRGLCKVVFATETLALGINMPARTVVIEKLDKWNGETHAAITPGEYTQLTGRAGRRGLDVEGHGVVLWQPGMNPRELAGLASTRTYPLRSSFRPSYNMAVNLVHQFGRTRSRELLEQSFAQFQADKAVVGLARQLRKAEDALDGYREAAACDRGDFMEYAALRQRISDVEKGASKARKADLREEAAASLKELKPGDVIMVPTGKFAGWAVVVDPGWSPEGPRPYVVTSDRQARRLAMIDFPAPVEAMGKVKIPKNFNGRNPQMRRDLASALKSRTHDLAPPRLVKQRGRDQTRNHADDEVSRLRDQLRAHPCHDCPDREDHARWAERWVKLDRDAQTLRRRVEQRTNTVARQFDRVCDVLTALDYLEGDTITERGKHLMRLYSDMDLVAAESIRLGLWDGLSPSELAAALSVLVFEARRPDDASSPRLPGGRVREVIGEMVKLWGSLDALERDHKLDFLRSPDLGFVWVSYRWAEGDDLDDVLVASDLAAGDFVRWMKQLIDLAGQVAGAAGDSALRDTARQAIGALRRGVVAYDSLADDEP
ncbi:RNA helicase [Nocardioides sp. Root1257]|uniref:DEAD/DEAH box helicase n=1 Tax=unclassified Nocardioides TaxID=2615069 RepID=UPI0006FCB6FC|nr:MULTISPECIES: DEAD/DEAH box helicase [unclassified Nocardioides]KQW52926.1 RNA helicase [Nocardioides sp. Root1257]KRC55614.1 RNA helicase [Nocardioides sp. Root224]